MRSMYGGEEKESLPMNLSQTSWSNPLVFNHSATSSILHSVGCVFFSCEVEVAFARSCDSVCVACGAGIVSGGADDDETVLFCFECIVLLKGNDDADGRPFATGFSRGGALLRLLSVVGKGRTTPPREGETGVGCELLAGDVAFFSGSGSGSARGGAGEKTGKEGFVAVGISLSSLGGMTT